ncbi:acetate kinase [Leucobacter sp. CSA1]|uniref:Acetate kinase n=1 Tax=Leucobacter chromiisoli TaxID=2796471 RepID=A0A934UWT4_9MICO|nr:acetate kinase [Leucobacter chromiisoli]MBK0420242.1 acetate kinase [Leucobacter chromiisoli]
MSAILVVNSGSSSIKYQLIDARSEQRLASGLIERIGQAEGRIEHRSTALGGDETREERIITVADHAVGFAAMIEAFARSGRSIGEAGLVAVGHRVVQGGSEFVAPTLIDERVEAKILELSTLAPLHNPANLQAIIAARGAFPDIPHVAVFDTAFHQTMPPEAYSYAIDAEVAREHGVRKYGFHGTSHQVVARRAAECLGRPVSRLKQIVLHLGNGASACAVDGGRSVDTSMGLTPLEGLVMGTRSGDIDPGGLLHLLRAGYDVAQLDELLNKRSGLLGLSGSLDMRDVQEAAAHGDERARLALAVYAHRIRRYLGAYLVELGGADAIVFTAGVGENVPAVRADVCAGLEWFGVRIDPERNESRERAARRISTDDSRIAVLVVPTDEEAEIARQTWQVVTAP